MCCLTRIGQGLGAAGSESPPRVNLPGDCVRASVRHELGAFESLRRGLGECIGSHTRGNNLTGSPKRRVSGRIEPSSKLARFDETALSL